MPTFEITSPDGAKFRIEGPEGSTVEQAVEQAQKLHQPSSPGVLGTALDIGKGAVRGLGTAIEQFPGASASLMGLAGRGAEALGLGDPEVAREREQFMAEHKPYMATEGLPKPETPAGRYAESIAGFGPAVVASKGTNLGRAATAVFGGAGAQTAEELFPQAGEAGRIVGGAVGAIVPSQAARTFRGTVSPQTTMSTDLARAIERDRDTPQAMFQRLQTLQQTRPEATLADVGGENVRGLVERLAQTPGAGRTTIVPTFTQRQQQQLSRISTDLRELTGSERTAFQATQDTMAERARTATPLYETAYNAGDREIWSPELERLSSSPTVQGAMQGAVRVWRDNAIADGFGAMNPGTMVERGGIMSRVGGQVPVFPNLQFWDYTKRFIDDEVRSAIRAGQDQKARTMTRLATMMRNALDREVPEYQGARNAWSGPSQYLDAIADGRNIGKLSSEELIANWSEMTEAQREGYRVGAVSSIVGKIGNNPAKLADLTRDLRSPEMRAKLSTIMPTPEAAAEFTRRLDFEISSSELSGRALKGSPTARRMAEQQQGAELVGDLVLHGLAHGTTLGLFQRIMMSSSNWLRDTLRSRADALLAERLVSQRAGATLRGAEAEMGEPGAFAAARQQTSRALAAGARQGRDNVIRYDADGNRVQ